MNAPTNMADYLTRFAENQRIEGHYAGTTMYAPCPFCAAPDFMSWKVLDVETAMEAGATCRECARSARAIFERGVGTTHFELVQTGGDDQPEWLKPKMRRVHR